MSPPLLKGGQGRSTGDVRRDASGVVFSLLLVVALVLLMVAKGCAP